MENHPDSIARLGEEVDGDDDEQGDDGGNDDKNDDGGNDVD